MKYIKKEIEVKGSLAETLAKELMKFKTLKSEDNKYFIILK